MKVLIVDDEPHIALLIQQALEDLEDQGVELLVASDGQQALDRIADQRPQLVFLDVMMPMLDGFHVCETVKRGWGMEEVHVVLLTAKGQEVDRERGARAGADHYITKPFDPDALLDLAFRVLGLTPT